MAATAHLVLDLDGTISNPALGIGRSLNYALEYFGYPKISNDLLSSFIGPPLDHAFRSITGTDSTTHITELVAKYRERYSQVGYSENVLYPGMPEAIASLAEAEVPLGICTSKRSDFAERILSMFGLRQYFRFIDGGEIGVEKKHQLAGLVRAESISLSSFMVGDRAVDVVAAKDNGLRSIGVLWGHGTAEEIRMAGPDQVFNSPHQLVGLRHAV